MMCHAAVPSRPSRHARPTTTRTQPSLNHSGRNPSRCGPLSSSRHARPTTTRKQPSLNHSRKEPVTLRSPLVLSTGAAYRGLAYVLGRKGDVAGAELAMRAGLAADPSDEDIAEDLAAIEVVYDTRMTRV